MTFGDTCIFVHDGFADSASSDCAITTFHSAWWSLKSLAGDSSHATSIRPGVPFAPAVGKMFEAPFVLIFFVALHVVPWSVDVFINTSVVTPLTGRSDQMR